MARGAEFAREMKLAFAPGTLWPDIAKRTAIFARGERDRLIASGEFAASYDTFVNGVPDAAEESIRPGGAILYRAAPLGAAVAMTLERLQRRVPVLTGTYRSSFMVAVGRGDVEGRAIPAASFDSAKVTADATMAYVWSPEPYSRRLDIGAAAAGRVSFRATDGIFGAVARSVGAAFTGLDVARIYTLRFPGREKRKDGRWIEYPAVEIRRRG